jgi:hypothetical protein
VTIEDKIAKYIAIDPGKTTGYAVFNASGFLIDMGKTTGEDKFLDWLEEQDCKIVIIEQYRNRGGFTNSFSDMPTSQHIGAISRIARKKKWVIVLQEPSPALVQGLRFIGMYTKYKGKHCPDDISALAHGTYYLRKNRILK